jgi:hypothetical protein
MNHKSSIIVTPALIVAALAFTAAEANAELPADDGGPAAVVPHDPAPPNYPSYAPTYPVPAETSTGSGAGSADDTAAEAFQAAASALGGAGIAFAGMWLYRRRMTHIA